MAQSLFVSLQPKLPFSGCVNHRRGATAVKIPSAAASSFSSGIFERCNKILVDDLQQTKPFSIIQEHRTKSFSLILPRNTDSKPQVLGSGFILWKNYISLTDQVEIVNICQEFGVGPWGFYQPSFQNGVKLRLHMMCFGMAWDPRCQYGRSHLREGSPISLIPDYLISLVETSIQDSQAHLNSELEIPIMQPDVCIVSFYSTTGRLGFHQDLNETLAGIKEGWPVVSISIGDSAEFLYGHTENMNKADVVLLESGDVLIFGGKSRDIYHGVKRIIPNSAPLALLEHTLLKPGRLNLSFRQF